MIYTMWRINLCPVSAWQWCDFILFFSFIKTTLTVFSCRGINMRYLGKVAELFAKYQSVSYVYVSTEDLKFQKKSCYKFILWAENLYIINDRTEILSWCKCCITCKRLTCGWLDVVRVGFTTTAINVDIISVVCCGWYLISTIFVFVYSPSQ